MEYRARKARPERANERRFSILDGEMWQFVVVASFLIAVLLAVTGPFVPRRTPDDLLKGERRQDPGGGLRGADLPRLSASSEYPEKD